MDTMTTSQTDKTDKLPASLDALIDRFLDAIWTERGLSPNTLGAYRADLMTLARGLAEKNISIEKAEKADLLEFIAGRVESGAKPRSTARQLSSFRRFYRYIMREGMRDTDPTADIAMPRIGRSLPKTLTEEEVDGLLQAPKGTKLYQRMEGEGRLVGEASGDNVEGTTNIRPIMDLERLHAGYREILNTIYRPKNYYARVKTLLKEYRCPAVRATPTRYEMAALFRSVYRLGIVGRERLHYWKLLVWALFRKPEVLPMAVTLAISGYHFRKVCELHVR